MAGNDLIYTWSGIVLDDQGRPIFVQRAFANCTASGDTQIVAAQAPGVKTRVLSMYAIAASAVTFKFRSATTDISPSVFLATNGGFVLPNNDHGWIQTNAGEALNVNINANVNVGVQITWIPINP